MYFNVIQKAYFTQTIIYVLQKLILLRLLKFTELVVCDF